MNDFSAQNENFRFLEGDFTIVNLIINFNVLALAKLRAIQYFLLS